MQAIRLTHLSLVSTANSTPEENLLTVSYTPVIEQISAGQTSLHITLNAREAESERCCSM